jgi:hypothetical protein
MRKRLTPLLICSGMLLLLLLFKKSQHELSEIEEPLFLEAQQRLRENCTDEAFALLNKLTEERKLPCQETHFQLGQLSVRRDPICAIYHLQRYLSQTTDGAHSELAMQ